MSQENTSVDTIIAVEKKDVDNYGTFQDPSFWSAVAFVLLIIVIFRPVAKFVTAALDKRSQKIADDLKRANHLREEAQKMLASYQRKQRDVEKEIELLKQRAKNEYEQSKKEAKERLETELSARMKLADQKISNMEKKAMEDIRHNAIKIAISVTEEYLATQLSEEALQAIIDKSVQDLESKISVTTH